MAHSIPAALNVRLHADEQAAIVAIQAAISVPHRRPATLSEAVRAALMMTAETVRERSRPAAE